MHSQHAGRAEGNGTADCAVKVVDGFAGVEGVEIKQAAAGDGDIRSIRDLFRVADDDLIGRVSLVFGVVIDAVGADDEMFGALSPDGVAVAAVDAVAGNDDGAASVQVKHSRLAAEQVAGDRE